MKTVARILALAGLVAILGFGASAPVGASPASAPAVDIQPAAGLAPDGRSIGIQVLASCPERWTVVEAVVRVSQTGVSGQASFPLTCIGSLRPFNVTVPSSDGAFQLGDSQVSASVVIKRGRTARADDSQIVPLFPIVLVELAETAQLESGGGAVVIGVAVACSAQTSGIESRLVVSQGQAQGVGIYVPICDGSPHTFTVRVEASQGVYQAGIAQSLTFANVVYAEEIFYGIDDDGSLEIVS